MATIDHDSHGHAHSHTAHAPDKAAGFMGLIVGVILLLAVMYGIVVWTNGRFEGHAAGTTTGAPAAKH